MTNYTGKISKSSTSNDENMYIFKNPSFLKILVCYLVDYRTVCF